MQNYSPQTAAMVAELQRNARGVPAPGAMPMAPAAPLAPVGADPFARGGAVKPLPSNGTAGKLVDTGLTTGLGVASKIAGSTAAGAAGGAGISLGTDLLAKKLRTKEEMPTFGGANSAYLDDLGRRFQGTGGGIASNAVKYAGYGANPGLVAATGGLSVAAGALGGAIKGAITKHAPSAYTDFRVEDAANAIKAQYKKELGREASDEEVMTHLKNQGWDGKSRWVGEKNLNSLMNNIRSTPEAQAFKANGVAAGGAPAPAAAPAALGPLGEGGGDPFAIAPRPAPTTLPGGQAIQTATAAQSPATAALASRLSVPEPTVDTTVPAGATRELPNDFPNLGTVTDTQAPAAAPAADGVDRSTWNTDGYDPPAYTPPSAGEAPPGWDAEKWNDPTHQTPKYGVGRILNQFPATVEGLTAAAADVAKAYPGTTFNGKDKLNIPGVGEIDVLKAAGEGGKGWQWDDGSGGGEQAAGADAGGLNGLVDATGGASNQSDVTALIASLLGRQGASSSDALTKTLLNAQRSTA